MAGIARPTTASALKYPGSGSKAGMARPTSASALNYAGIGIFASSLSSVIG
jgi:hypothetical protein